MNIDPDDFTVEQDLFLSQIVSDLNGPTATRSLLRIVKEVIYTLKPDFNLDLESIDNPDLMAEIECCLAALQYVKVKEATDRK